MALRTVGVRLVAEVGSYVSSMRRASDTTRTFHQSLSQQAATGQLDAIADRAGVMGLAIGAGFGMAVKSSMDFEKQMSAVKAATHASAGEVEKLRAAAIKAGADTQYSATEAARGIEELSKAGVSSADILGGGLKGALSLAAAGSLDVGEAAETAASAMTQFKLKGDAVPHVADLLSAAAGKAQGSVHDMGAALNQVGLIAASTGLSIEDTTGTLAAFASAGLIGSDAGTSFKTMLQAIQAPSNKTKELMDELGVSAYDTAGNFIGIAKFAQNLKDKLSVLTPQMRANAMAQIFGSDATRAANILYEQGADGIQKWIDKTNDAGYASETAATKTDNLAGDLERLKGSLDTLLIQSGSGANGGLRAITKSLEAMVDQFGKLPTGMTSTITVLGGLSAALLLGGAAWVKARASIAATIAELNAVGPAGARAATGLQAASKWAGRAAVAFVALEALGAVSDEFGNSAVNVDRMTASLQNFASTGKMSGEITDDFGANLENFSLIAGSAEAASHGFWKGLNDLTSSIPGVSSVVDSMNESIQGTSFNDAAAQMSALDESFTAFIATQKDAKAAGEIWNQLLVKSGLDTQQLAQLLPNAWKGLGELQKAAHGAAGAQGDLAGATGPATEQTKQYASSADAAAAAARGQRDALADLATKMKAETDPVFGLLDAQRDLTKAQKDASKAVKDHGKNSDEAREATRKLAEAAIKLQGKAGELSDTFDGKMTPALRQTLKAGGLTETQIKQVAGEFTHAKKTLDAYDGTYEADVSAPGVKDADTKVKALWDKLKGVDGNWTAHIKTSGYTDAKNKLLALLAAQQTAKNPSQSLAESRRELGRFMATGGPVVGPGTGTSDSVPAWLSNGEHVWTADEVDALGGQKAVYRLRAAVRAGKRVEVGDDAPGFAAGGAVMPYRYDVSKTKIPEVAFGSPPGGRTSDWIVRVVRAAFPGMAVLSQDRPGAITLTGNRSYHSMGRAVDFPASRPLAEWINANYKARTRELITPWNSLNIHNGRRHTYTGAVFRQHNFAGGNAHDHWAMANGGLINEPIVGVGASGRTYSFGEYGPETVTPGTSRLMPAPPAPIVVQVAMPRTSGQTGSAPIIGHVTVQDPTDVDLLVNRISFAMGGL